MNKLLTLTALAILTVGTAAGCRGGLGCMRQGDHCDPCHACNVTTPVMTGAPEIISPSPTRSRGPLPGPTTDASANG